MRSTLISPLADGLFRLMQGHIERVLFDGPAIHKRIDEMAAQIAADYSGRDQTVIAILTGSLMFMSDLLRRIPLFLRLDYLGVATYHGKTTMSGDVIFKQSTVPDVAGRDVLFWMISSIPVTRWQQFERNWKPRSHAAFEYVCC